CGSSIGSLRHAPPCCGAAGHPDLEFGELAGAAVDGDGTAVLLDNDVVADGRAEAGPLARRLGREERGEELLAHLRRHADAVVAHPDLYLVADVARRHAEDGPVIGALAVALPLRGGVESIAEEVEEDPGDVLRHHLDRLDVLIEVALKRDVEGLILRTRTVISEIERLLDQRVEIDALAIAAAAARMQQHAAHDAVGAPSVLGDLRE